VRLDGDGAVGEVIELEGKEAVLALGPMRTRVALKRLTKVGGPAAPPKRERRPATPASASAMPALTAQHRIDVRGQRVDEVVPVVTRLVDEAVMAGLQSVEILHGKGTGALRQVVREHLAARPDVAGFDDAAWDAGGPGVTVVTLR
jgi:DNA mismatch repair protein MutS2